MVCQLTPLAYYTIYCLLVYTPFIICSLVFSNDPNNAVCMNTFVQNDSLNNLNLNLWLRVYGYISSGFLVGLFIGLLLFYGTCPKAKICMVVSSIFLVVWFSLFQMTWNVIGGYIFWSGLEQTCSELSNYLYSHFIINFIAVPVNFIVVHIFRGKNNRQQNYDVKNKASFGQADQESVPNL